MLTRREFIRTAALFALAPHVFSEREKEIWVNDVHSQLKRTRVRELLKPRTRDELAEVIRPWRVIRFFDYNDLRDTESGLNDKIIAKGEVICLAAI